MNIFLHELKSYRKSTIIWTCSMSALIIFLLSIYPGFAKDVTDFQKLLEGYPETVRKAMGISGDIFSLLGFYSFGFLYILLTGSIQAMNLGVSIISKEARLKTADFLLTKPVTRGKVIMLKLLSAFVSLVITNAVYLTAAVVMANIVKTESFSIKKFMMISITLLFVQLIFMSLGFIAAVIVPKIKSVLSISLSTVFGFFILNMFSSVIGEKTLRYITPFKYYDAAYIIKHSAYETNFIIIEILFIAAAVGAGYLIYSKKDIKF